LSIFGPITTAAGALSNVDMTEPLNFDALLSKVAEQQQLNLMDIGKAPIAATSQEAIRKALKAANAHNALPKGVFDKLLQEAPQTQAGMQKALATSGNAEVAKKAAQAPAAPKQVSSATQQNIARAAQQAQTVIARAAPAAHRAQSVSSIPVGGEASNTRRKSATPNPAASVKKAMPMANMQAMVTRPISTMAIQTAAASVRNAAAQRAREKGAVLPGQVPPKARSVAGGPTGAAKPGGQTANTGKKLQPLTAANLAAASKKQTTGSRPLGTQKYANGKKLGRSASVA
jgi:hypothetical protein